MTTRATPDALDGDAFTRAGLRLNAYLAKQPSSEAKSQALIDFGTMLTETNRALNRALAAPSAGESEPPRGYVLEYDAENRWLVMNDPDGASEIVARDVRGIDADYLIAGYDRLAAPAPTGDAGLDAAWKAVEAVLPEGWRLVLSWSPDAGIDAYAINPVMSSAWEATGNGATPAAALDALRAALQETNREAGRKIERGKARAEAALAETAHPSPVTEGAEGPHRHRYGLIPVWREDRSAVESWWWCTDHPTGEWVRIEDDADAAEAIPGWAESGRGTPLSLGPQGQR